ncbi:MAG: S1 RNA-binding domain-containing protein, partial [Deltaproteobacteria bacterium]
QVLKEGQEITVEVLEIDQQQRRIALARVPQEGEFGEIPVVGATVEGIVDGIANFGVFVRLGPGRKGLVPNPELGIDRGADPRRFFKPGDTVKVKVLDVQENGKRIRLSRKAVLEEQERGQVEGYLAQAGQDQQVSLGTLGDILRKKLGK